MDEQTDRRDYHANSRSYCVQYIRLKTKATRSQAVSKPRRHLPNNDTLTFHVDHHVSIHIISKCIYMRWVLIRSLQQAQDIEQV